MCFLISVVEIVRVNADPWRGPGNELRRERESVTAGRREPPRTGSGAEFQAHGSGTALRGRSIRSNAMDSLKCMKRRCFSGKLMKHCETLLLLQHALLVALPQWCRSPQNGSPAGALAQAAGATCAAPPCQWRRSACARPWPRRSLTRRPPHRTRGRGRYPHCRTGWIPVVVAQHSRSRGTCICSYVRCSIF